MYVINFVRMSICDYCASLPLDVIILLFFISEKKGNLTDGLFDMPSTILPEAMAEILKFMYSGNKTFLQGRLQ